nr:molybdenum cofactor guanylyltransferase [Geotalea sp. SG265]
MKTVTGVILAGGTSSRMGSNKALLPYRGRRLIETVYGRLTAVFSEVLVVTNVPQQYRFLPCMKVRDVFAGGGALAGIHAGLCHSGSPVAFVVACDMPYLDSDFIRHMALRAADADVVIPKGSAGLEPLHAIYGRACLPAMEASLARGEKKISSFFAEVDIEIVPEEEIASFDPAFKYFRNINTPMDYYRLRAERHSESPFFRHFRSDADSRSLSLNLS